jgi:hypothetical protein
MRRRHSGFHKGEIVFGDELAGCVAARRYAAAVTLDDIGTRDLNHRGLGGLRW